MTATSQLSPKEQHKLERYIRSVSTLVSKKQLSGIYKFIMQRQMQEILRLLGSKYPTLVMVDSGLQIIKDIWPFKKWRLRKLING